MHGTGDDDGKDENWMKWVAVISELHGHPVLIVDGAHSSKQTQVTVKATEFLDRHLSVVVSPPRTMTRVQGYEALIEALSGTIVGHRELGRLNDMFISDTVSKSKAIWHIKQLKEGQRRENTFATRSAIGIKFRIAVAAVCVGAYWRCHPDPKPVRIIGHSRGGAAAVGLHNFLTSFGIPCENTLTLDPCHGLVDFNGKTKDYYTKIWFGQLYNIPCQQNVADMPEWTMMRPPITKGEGASSDCVVFNHEMLREIKHGHMGKLTAIKKPKSWNPWTHAEEKRAMYAKKITVKEQAANFSERQNLLVHYKGHLLTFFQQNVGVECKDARKVIYEQVIQILTTI